MAVRWTVNRMGACSALSAEVCFSFADGRKIGGRKISRDEREKGRR
ncbi:MAG: hypothetical protein K9L24_03830 [Spirochaetia bacterium]|nr:hypothetical protein [Spirochaetia bacterium]MCF7953277.1 hypothetical protein [Spirochaetales bacterium]